MPKLPRLQIYQLTEKLGESFQASIYKAYHKNHPERLLVLKRLKLLSSWEDQSRYLQQKIERLKVLHDNRVCTPLALETDVDWLFIIQPWFAGKSLEDWVISHYHQPNNGIHLDDFFAIACSITEILAAVHEAGITHGGVKPHNILVQPGTLTLRLTDFITPLDIRDVSHFIYDPEFVRGTLAYASPEQTGRINYRVDFSTDLYSLGIVFYELLTGKLPFFSTDPLELIHSHLAEEAPKVHAIKPAIPGVLSDIVAKLVLKQPERRYQSASGLLADIRQCRDEFLATGAIRKFAIGRHDRTRRVIFISKMVGREGESALIKQLYQDVTQGQFRSLFISGFSGIGKTRLIQELQTPLVQHHGYFTAGKFDQYQKNIPYSSLIQALRNLIRVFLTENDQQVAQWKERILDAVGQNGSVIMEVVPELEFIIGSQPKVPHLPPVEARNRFNYLFGKFLVNLTSKENPLVLFIDDLQWCDLATFEFLQNIFNNHQDYPYLFFIGAYRHNEVDSAHPLTRMIRVIKEQQGPLQEVQLQALSDDDCHEMVAYILDSSLKTTENLARFVAKMTEGNPLFVSEILAWLHHESLLHMDERQHWAWDMDKIRDTRMPDSVVGLFSAKVCKLPKETLSILNYCACLGNRFTVQELEIILSIDISELFDRLKPVLSLGMILENKTDLQFVHDRVQEAVLRQIGDQERPEIHWQIGQKLLADNAAEVPLESMSNLFTITVHLNKGRPEKLDSSTAYQLADLNYHAGNKALDALASESANGFFRTAYEYLPEQYWDFAYELSFRIFQHLAKTELMCGRYEASESLLNQLIDHAASDLDKAEALAEQTTSLSSFGNFKQAIVTANRGLSYFGKAIPDDPIEANQRMQTLMATIEDQGDVWHTILQMPFTDQRKSKIELAFYSELIPDLYMSGWVPQLYLSAAQSTLHCLEGGMDESVIYSFTIMGLNLGEQMQFDQAFRYQDLAHELCTRHPNTFGATRGINGIVWCNMHSRSHPSAIVDYSLQGIQCGKNCGDLYNAGLSYGPLMWNLVVQSKNLQRIEETADECLHFSRKNQLSFSVALAEAVLAGWVTPMKQDAVAVEMDNTLLCWQSDNYVAASGSYFVLQGMSQYLLGDYAAAAQSLSSVNQYLHGLTDNVLKRLWIVFRTLNLLRLQETGALTWSEIQAEIAPLLEMIEMWAKLGPLLRPYLAFIHAEIAHTAGRRRVARNLYLDAIAEAQNQDYGLLTGHLYECLADLTMEIGIGNADLYYAEALRIYELCHAEAKQNRLRIRCGHLIDQRPKTTESLPVTSSQLAILPNLDVNYLIKSSLAMSEQINLDQLLQKIMSVVMESSAAQYGFLLIKESSELVVAAEHHVGQKHLMIGRQYPLAKATNLCKSIVHYVFRTQSKIVLSDAVNESEFQNDPEVKQHRMRSVLCLPLIKQARLVGVLYLENRLSEGIFTPEKTSMIEFLATPAAIALENARLLEETQQANLQLKKNEKNLQLAASVFTHAREGIIITDAEASILEVNHTFTQITGYSREEVLGKNPRIFHSGRQTSEFYKAMWQALLEKGHWYSEIWNRRKNGEVYAEMLTISAVRDSAGVIQNYVALFSDITSMKEHQQQLEHIAHYDALTNLPNRVLLADRLQQAMIHTQRSSRLLVVAYLDLDGFKLINDRHGHKIGDELLIMVAQKMKSALREGDTLARMGGDEFVAILVDLERAEDSEPVLERLLRAAAEPVLLADLQLHVSASVGTTIYPDDGVDADQLLRHADQAMYQAKQTGKNRYFRFDVSSDTAASSHPETISDIRMALIQNEFVLYYQPKVNMNTGEVIGAEALIRWQHPKRGLLQPIDFLPMIGEHPISEAVDQWVINAALKQMAAWTDEGYHLPVSVNIGARQLQSENFVSLLQSLLVAYPQVKPGDLELEILETSALEDIAQISQLMITCRDMGIRFSIDDFGTGYSSLTYLKHLPADVLKIDQSFVRDMLDDPDDLAIVEAVIGLSGAFRRKVIAEGVETHEHGRLLMALNCDLAQGYGIARPMPAESIPDWISSWHVDAAWFHYHERNPNRDALLVTLTEVGHRYWLNRIKVYLAGTANHHFSIESRECHFARWYKNEGEIRYGQHPLFLAAIDIHQRIHYLGDQLVVSYPVSQGDIDQAMVDEIEQLIKELTAKLQKLLNLS